MDVVEKEIAVGEFTVNFASAGNGSPLLMLHGSDPNESWHVWEPLMSMADSRRVVAPDLLGHGKSTKPAETPDYRSQARMLRDMGEKLGLQGMSLMGNGWGGQVALELALEWPKAVTSIVLVASSYDKEQLLRLQKLRKPTLIIFAEDDMVMQIKSGYMLRDAIGMSRLEVFEPVSRDPREGFTMSHRLLKFRAPQVMQLAKLFLSNPEAMVSEPPEMENELRGRALRKENEKDPAIWKP